MKAARQNKHSRGHYALTWLRLKYRLATALEAAFGDAFWFFHRRAVRLQDQLDQQDALPGRTSRGVR
jgi:hypothetical protein